MNEYVKSTILTLAIRASVGLVATTCGGSHQHTAPPGSEPRARYPMCVGQHIPEANGSPRTGPVDVQLAPAFLDEMAACRPEDLAIQDLVAKAGSGKIDVNGDCEFSDTGVTCHYHSGSEFVTVATTKQISSQGEIHCIFPSGEAKSPRVFGGHVICRNREDGLPADQHSSHAVHQGAACSAALLRPIVDQCTSFRCCDDGTLTGPIAELKRQGRNDVRPDFRICSDTLLFDCSLLAELTPHVANSPALGGVGEPVFGVSSTRQRQQRVR